MSLCLHLAAGTGERSEESNFQAKTEILRRFAAQNDMPKVFFSYTP